MLQALAAWKWYNYTEKRCEADKRILRVNVDETSICQWLFATCGNVMRTRRREAGSVPPRAPVPRSSMRRHVTYSAFVCDDPELQACMPQIIIANESSLRVGDLAALKQRAAPNQIVLREKSAWNNGLLFRKSIDIMLTLLGSETVAARHIILFFDCAKAHIQETVLRHCANKGIHVVVIPAKTTSLLQPLDTHIFSQFKHMLRKRYAAAQVLSQKTVLPMPVVIMLVWATAKSVLEETHWARAFEEDGWSSHQTTLRRSLLRAMQWIEVLCC